MHTHTHTFSLSRVLALSLRYAYIRVQTYTPGSLSFDDSAFSSNHFVINVGFERCYVWMHLCWFSFHSGSWLKWADRDVILSPQHCKETNWNKLSCQQYCRSYLLTFDQLFITSKLQNSIELDCSKLPSYQYICLRPAVCQICMCIWVWEWLCAFQKLWWKIRKLDKNILMETCWFSADVCIIKGGWRQ